ncbi:hypothetical protein CsSME_00007707 [Camellia sinensis var. sinensis]
MNIADPSSESTTSHPSTGESFNPVMTTISENLNPSLKITTSLFNSLSVLTLFLKSRRKMGYVDRRVQALNIIDSGYDQLEITNSLIMMWLIHSTVPEIGEVFKFLEGLNVEFDPEAFAYVQNEESRHFAMLPPNSTYHSTLLSSTPSRDGAGLPLSSSHRFGKDNLFCDYCRQPRHTRETCWKLHGTSSRGRDLSGHRGGRSSQSRGRGSYSRAHQSSTVETHDSAPVM